MMYKECYWFDATFPRTLEMLIFGHEVISDTDVRVC